MSSDNNQLVNEKNIDNVLLAVLDDFSWDSLRSCFLSPPAIKKFYAKFCYFVESHHNPLTMEEFRQRFTFRCSHCDIVCLAPNNIHWYKENERNEPYSRNKWICLTFGILRRFCEETGEGVDLLRKITNDEFKSSIYQMIRLPVPSSSTDFIEQHSSFNLLSKCLPYTKNFKNCRILVADFLDKECPHTTYHTPLLFFLDNIKSTFSLYMVPEVTHADELAPLANFVDSQIQTTDINVLVFTPESGGEDAVSHQRQELIIKKFQECTTSPLVSVVMDDQPQLIAMANRNAPISFPLFATRIHADMRIFMQHIFFLYEFTKRSWVNETNLQLIANEIPPLV